jgi:hypothetical protein
VAKHHKILDRMRRTKSGWKPRDFEGLYTGFGFEAVDLGKHTKYRHPTYPQLWTTVKRADPLSKAYAEDAVELIDQLQAMEGTEP